MDHLISDFGYSASTFSRKAVHQVATNILPRVEREFRDNIVPKLERKGKEIQERWKEKHTHDDQQQRRGAKRRRRRPRPPSNTDIVYITERFLVSSKPASDYSSRNGPTFLDIGRDISARETRDKRQQVPRKDRTCRQNGINQPPRHAGSQKFTEESFKNRQQEGRANASIPEEEGHYTPIHGDSSSIQVESKKEAEHFSENPQDGGVTAPDSVEATIGDLSDATINDLEGHTRSLASKTTTAGIDFPNKDLSMKSIHSSGTDIIVNRDESAHHEEPATPLTKNLPAREITSVVIGEQPINDGALLIPTLPLPSSTPLIEKASVSASKSGSGTGSDDESVVSFATCRMDDGDTCDTPSEKQEEPRSERAIQPTKESSASIPTPSAASIINSPGNMVTFLDKVHGRDRYLAVSLAKEKPDDRTLLLFRRQIVPLGLSRNNGNHQSSPWSPCCVERSETPSIPHMLKICYAIHAFLHLDPNNVVLTYCDNGKTRTAIAAACYLRFSNLVERTEDGFRYFLSTLRKQRKLLLLREKERRKEIGPFLAAVMDAILEDYYDDEEYNRKTNGHYAPDEGKGKNDEIVDGIIKQIPPSLKLFFEQFDKALQLGGFLNRKPLLLRAIMVQGVPVEDQPCLDIWDASQRHVYSSHLPVSTSTSRNNTKKPASQWVDEEGFYRTNVVLDGEFLVLCRFGGDLAQLSKDKNIHDPSRILFRYTNTTGFMSGGFPYELRSKKVDLMRMYAEHLDDDEFLLTLLFEADWQHIENDKYDADTSISASSRKRLRSTSKICGERIWRSHEEEACDEGWRVIFENHSARPAATDIDSFRRVYRYPSSFGKPDMSQCPDHLVALSLQLTNYDFQRTAALLEHSPGLSWWWGKRVPMDSTTGEKHEYHEDPPVINLNFDDGPRPTTFLEKEEIATQGILDILDSVDITPNLDPIDEDYLHQWKINSSLDGSLSKEVNLQDRQTLSRGEYHTISNHQNSLSEPCLRETGYLIPSTIYPHRGDVVRSFHIHGSSSPPENRIDENSVLTTVGKRKQSLGKPRIPYFSEDKPKILPPPSDHIAMAKYLFDREKKDYQVPVYDYKLEAAKEIHSQLLHTGVTLEMLLKLNEASKRWNSFPDPDEISLNTDIVEEADIEKISNPREQRESSMNREEKEKKEREWHDAQKLEAEEKRKAREQEKKENEAKEENRVEEALNGSEDDNEVPLKDDPDYGKYFKMLKLGMSREQVLHAFQRDGKDPKILDLDPNKSLEAQLPDDEDEILLKDHPEFSKYFKMLKIGMPRDQVLHAFQRDGNDPKILDLDPDKSLESQLPGVDAGEEDDFPLEDDPGYVKYFKMLKLGMPKEQVLHALKRDDKDSRILDLDPKKSLKSQLGISEDYGNGPPIKDDPEYSKYFKMMKMGMPKEQVLHALKRDGKDPKILDLDPDKSLKSQQQNDVGPPLREDPEYSKYFKMLQVGLTREAVKDALMRDGKDTTMIDLDPNKSLKSQISGEVVEKDTGTPLRDDPDYTKYFTMEKMGMPKDAIRHALLRDGKNSSVIDFDPNLSVEFQLKKIKSEKPGAKKKKKKKKVRRKRIYWNPIDPQKLKKDSLWNIVRDHVKMGKLDYDKKEFEELFTQSVEAGAEKQKKGPVEKEVKKAVQAIDAKRSMNGGIVLSTIKTDRKQIAEFVDKIDHTKFDAIQLNNLKEYLANDEERRALDVYMSKGESSEEQKKERFHDLSETEKYMVTLMKVPDAEAKLQTMSFRSCFKNRFADMTLAVRTLNSACDELRSSEKFRKLMAMILTVVNQINTGGEGTLAMGFTLDALLKLNEAKAFDKKTSVLHYVVKLVKKNDESLLYFENDLGHVVIAESIILDTIMGDLKVLQNELTEVIKIVTKDADRLEKSGEVAELTLSEMVEQKSLMQHIGNDLKQLNTTSQLTGRTPMERFSTNAKVACEQVLESMKNVQTKFVLVLEYFGEDEKMSTSDFFGILRRFMIEWKKVIIQVEKIERRKAKERKREAKRAAKMKKKAKGLKNSSRNKNDEEHASSAKKASVPLPIGIAALAAEGAMEKLKNEDINASPAPTEIDTSKLYGTSDSTNSQILKRQDVSPNFSPGGIGSFAAKNAFEKSNEGNQPSPVEGIANLASQAALKKSKKVNDTSPVEGISALTTGTALQKLGKDAHESEEVRPEPPVGGIAALAAQAVLVKSVKTPRQKSDKHIDMENFNSKTTTGDNAVISSTTKLETFEKQGSKDHCEQLKSNISSVAIHASLEVSEKQELDTYHSSDTSGLATLGVPKESSKRSIPEGAPLTSPELGISSLSGEVAAVPPQDKKPNDPSIGEMSSLAAQAASEIKDKRNKKLDNHKTSRIFSLDTPMDGGNTPTRLSLKEIDPDLSPNGETSSLAARVAVDKLSRLSSEELGPNRSPTSGLTSLAAQVALEKSQRQFLTEKVPNTSTRRMTPQRSLTSARSSLAMALEKVRTPSSPNKSPKRSPTGLMSSLAAALEKADQQNAARRKGPSLGSFFERNSRREVQKEIGRENNDDSTVARMAENLQKEQIHSNAWNQEEGISDYIGWADQAIKASDTDSVRDFESARDMLYDDQSTIATGMDDSTHYTNFDDGTIATNFDDDASFATNMTPKNDKTHYGGGSQYNSVEQYNNYAVDANDPYSYSVSTDNMQNPYGDAVINMPLEFNQDHGVSFGGEDGFDGPGEYGSNEMMRGGVFGDGLGGFGHDASHGEFGLSSPTTLPRNQVNHFTITGNGTGLGGFGIESPSTRQTNTTHKFTIAPPPPPPLAEGDADLNRPWGATPKSTRKERDDSRSRHWSDSGHNKATNRSKKIKTTASKSEEDNLIFRGWGAPPKEPEQPPKRKTWFGF